MISEKFILKDPKSDKETYIIMRCNYRSCSDINTVVVTIYTGLKVNPKNWLPKKQRASQDLKKNPQGEQMNYEIFKREHSAWMTFEYFEKENRKFTKEEFKTEYTKRLFKFNQTHPNPL